LDPDDHRKQESRTAMSGLFDYFFKRSQEPKDTAKWTVVFEAFLNNARNRERSIAAQDYQC
jgi:hypothetical protein